jgi:mannitol operon transcriptional antiterminator
MAERVESTDMVSLSTRQCAILRELLVAEKPVTTSQVASRLDITPRMVRYDLAAINSWLGDRHVRLIKRPNYGLQVGASGEIRADLHGELNQLTGYRLVLSPTERVHVLILSLLTSDQPLLASQLGPRVGVSYPTVLGDLRRAEAWLEKHNLHLIRRPRIGFLVAGSEADWREAVIEFLLEAMGEELSLALTAQSQTALRVRMRGKVGLSQALWELCEGLELDLSRELVDSAESLLQLQFADKARLALVFCLAIAMSRVQQGRTVELPSECLETLRDQREFHAAGIAAKEIAQCSGISLSEPEIVYIAMQLLGAGVRRPLSDIMAEGGMQGIDPEVLEAVADLLSEASIYLQPCLEVDQQLIRNLAFHLRAALNRLRFGLPIRNPLLAEIKDQYPYVFQVARRAAAVLEDSVGGEIPEEEIGYITMHLGAAMERLKSLTGLRRRVLIVCGEGTATAWLLVSRIQAELPEIEIVEVTSAIKVSKEYVLAHDIAAIISTVPITTEGAPVIAVSPLLQPQDIASIQKALRLGVSPPGPPVRPLETTGCSLADLLHAETIALQVAASNWVDVVHEAGDLLLSTGAIEPEYVQAMQSLIEQHGPYVVIMPGVALLHAHPGKGVNRICMSMVTLKEPVRFGHPRHDPVRLAVAMGTIDDRSHWRALRQLVDLLNDAEMVSRIQSIGTKGRVVELISEISQGIRGPTSVKVLSQ